MKLYFTCPKAKTTFSSDDYSLHKGHRVVEDELGAKELQGRVSLNSACPLCGHKHSYEVKDILCSLTGRTNEK